MNTYKSLLNISVMLFMCTTHSACTRLEIEGSEANLTIQSSEIDFGLVSTIENKRLMIAMTNTGDSAATGINVDASNPDYHLSDPTSIGTNLKVCDTSVLAKETCSIGIEFNPSSTGNLDATITIQFFNGRETKSVQLQARGKGVPPPQAHLVFQSMDPYLFPTTQLGSQVQASINIENQGTAAATMMGFYPFMSHFRFSGGTYPGTTGTCGSFLGVGSVCSIDLEFVPTVSGPLNGLLSLQYFNGLTMDSETLGLSGLGDIPGLGFLGFAEGLSKDLGSTDITQDLAGTLTLVNSGNLGVSNLVVSGLNPPFTYQGGGFPGLGGTCLTTLPAGSSCNIVINFNSPTPGVFSNTLNISYDNGSATVSTGISLSATATPFDPAILDFLESSPHSFGSVNVDDTQSYIFTVQNTGELNATSISANLSSPFHFSGGSYPGTLGTCGTSLSRGLSCTLDISFSPTIGGMFSRTLTLSFNNGYLAATKVMTLTGIGIPGGVLDPSFGSLGILELDFSVEDQMKSLNIQADSKILIAGYENPTADEDVSILRLDVAGTLDPSFATGGRKCYDLLSSSLDIVLSSSLQPDGKLIATGVSNDEVITLRYNTDGSTDNTFDALGLSRIVIPLLTTAAGQDLSIAPDGKVVIVGKGMPLLGTAKSFAFRLTSLGIVDLLNFGLTGIRTYDFSTGDESLNSVRHDSAGKILVAGYAVASSVKKALVARLGTNGAVDTAYASSGQFIQDFSGSGKENEVLGTYMLNNDKLIGVGYVGNSPNKNLLVFRMNSNGTLDSSFGNSGFVTIDIAGQDDQANSVTVDGIGRIIVAGSYTEAGQSAVALLRLSSLGVLDPKFGNGGIVKTPLNTQTWGNDVKIQPDGKIVVGGRKAGTVGSNYLVLRYLP